MEEIKQRAEKLLQKLNVLEKRKRVRELESESAKPEFWQNHQVAAKKMKDLSLLQKEIEEVELLELFVSEGNEKEADELLGKLERLMLAWNEK